jgi:hypothetical protein
MRGWVCENAFSDQGNYMKLTVKDQISAFKVVVDNSPDIRLTFKIVVYVDEDHKFSCNVERQDLFRLQPSFQSTTSDEEIYVADLFFKTSDRTFDSVEDLKMALLAEIQQRFTVSIL